MEKSYVFYLAGVAAGAGAGVAVGAGAAVGAAVLKSSAAVCSVAAGACTREDWPAPTEGMKNTERMARTTMAPARVHVTFR